MRTFIIKTSLLWCLGTVSSFGGGMGGGIVGGGTAVPNAVVGSSEVISSLGVDNTLPNIDSLIDEAAVSVSDGINKK